MNKKCYKCGSQYKLKYRFEGIVYSKYRYTCPKCEAQEKHNIIVNNVKEDRR
jgi:hypothetical protein